MSPNSHNAPLVLGILGGVASGKSTVARLLAKRGAAVIDADKAAHRVLERPDIKQKVGDEFGEEVLADDGSISRQKLGELVFGNDRKLAKLNEIVHPPVITQIRRRIENIRREGSVPVIALDAALLMEKGLHRELCDALLFVSTSREARVERATRNRDWSSEVFERREQAQMDVEEKRGHADIVVSNEGSLEELDEQVQRVWEQLLRTHLKERTEANS